MNQKDYTYSFFTNEKEDVVFKKLLNVNQWWSGLYSETFSGNSAKLNDEFSFHAGGGAHYSKQKLVELEPNQKITWEITESNLSFLEKENEWTATRIGFDIKKEGGKTKVTFIHQGLTPQLECYGSCSGAWTQYLEKLRLLFN